MLTLTQLKERLHYSEVTENERLYEISGRGYADHLFFIHDPVRPSSPIEFGFDRDCKFVQFIGWMSWHTHFDEHPHEEVNIAKAIAFIRKLILKRKHLYQYFDAAERYQGGSIIDSRMLHWIATDCYFRDGFFKGDAHGYSIVTFSQPELRVSRAAS